MKLKLVLGETTRYLSGLGKLADTKTPAQLIFFVTNRCNAHCPFCFYWRQIEQNKEKELTLLEIKKISSSMRRIFWLHLSGGEPYLRRDLAEIVEVFWRQNKIASVSIPTNATLSNLVVSQTDKILQKCPGLKVIVTVSIDEIGTKHNRLRQVERAYEKARITVQMLKKLQQKFPCLAIMGNIVYSSYNKKRIREIYKRIGQEFSFDNICVSLVRGKPRQQSSLNVNLKGYLEAHLWMKSQNRFRYHPFPISWLIQKKEDMMAEMFYKSIKSKRAIIPCLAGRQIAVLRPNGDIFPCELRENKLGNLREANCDFNKIWQGIEAQRQRREIVKNNCFCTHECIYTTNVFLQPKGWLTLIKYALSGKI